MLTPEPCPAGTYRSETAGGNVTDCHICPAGNYCPLNASTAYIPCSNGSYCPNGTILPRFCVPGFYCPEAKVQIPCPSGFYCPAATPKRLPCPRGHYCPGVDNCTISTAGTVVPKICPAGKSYIMPSINSYH